MLLDSTRRVFFYVPFCHTAAAALQSAFCACTLGTYISCLRTDVITIWFFLVYVVYWLFKMPPIIVSPADCEVRAVIRFLSAKGLKPIDIHREICAVYGQNIMSDGMVRKWVKAFKDGLLKCEQHTCVCVLHDEQRSGHPSVVNESLVQEVDNKVRENRCFTISSLCDDFPNVSRSVLYGIVMQWLTSQAADFYEEGIQKLVQRHDKCFNIEENYVEK